MEFNIVEDCWICCKAGSGPGKILKNSLAFFGDWCEVDVSESSRTVDILFGWMRSHFDFRVTVLRVEIENWRKRIMIEE